MADEGVVNDAQSVVSTQADVGIPFDDLCKKLNERGKTKLVEVFTKCKDIYEKNGSRLNLDILDEICKRVETFAWSDDDLENLEELSNEKITVDKDDILGKVYNDPIHGNIKIHPVCQAIIDTPQFQRLRDLKQMGMVSHVYPGAVHTRFEHSLGVCYLAGEFARTLQRNQPFLSITNKDVLCVQIAGLCHDLGHGPFSHLFDEVVNELDEKNFSKHEQRSVTLLEYLLLINRHKLAESFKKYDLSKDKDLIDEKDLNFIKEMILTEGDTQERKGRHKLKHFLYEIVSNESSGVDVDKFDYLSRDSLHLGMKNNFDHRRFMMFARVNFKDGCGHICVRDKELTNLYNMYITRYTHQKFVWNHHVNKCAELMISKVLKLAAPHHKLKLEENGPNKLLRDCTARENIGEFSQLTDNIITQILCYKPKGLDKKAKDMKKAQQIIQRISNRDFYKCIYESKPFGSENKSRLTEEQIKDCKDKITDKSKVDGSDFEVKFYSMDLGKKDKNALDYVFLYSKSNPYEAKTPQDDERSKILAPVTSIEYIVRVIYCGDNIDMIDLKQFKKDAETCVNCMIKNHNAAKNASECNAASNSGTDS